MTQDSADRGGSARTVASGPSRSGKLASLAEAVATVPDGAVVALSGNTLHRAPCALVHELVRQGKRGLELVKTAASYDVDLLCAAGCAAAVHAGYVGYENVLGLAQGYRAAVEEGRVAAREHACASLIAALRAAAQGVPFMPVAGMLGSDLLAARGFAVVHDPYSDTPVVVVPALVPDVALVHVHAADPEGNARIEGPLFEDLILVRAARRVILTTERIADPEEFASAPERTTIPGLLVDRVVLAPGGAWPTGCPGRYSYDLDYLRTFREACEAPATLAGLLEEVLARPLVETGGRG